MLHTTNKNSYQLSLSKTTRPIQNHWCKARFTPPQATLNQWQVELNRTSIAVELYA